jgi:hypothetical protein
MPHEVDDIGYPVDPVLRRLEFRLGDLAGMWRTSYGDTAKQTAIIKEYHDVMERLYSLGWDSGLDLESELPDKYMPEEYQRRVQRSPIHPDSWGDPALWYGNKREQSQ